MARNIRKADMGWNFSGMAIRMAQPLQMVKGSILPGSKESRTPRITFDLHGSVEYTVRNTVYGIMCRNLDIAELVELGMEEMETAAKMEAHRKTLLATEKDDLIRRRSGENKVEDIYSFTKFAETRVRSHSRRNTKTRNWEIDRRECKRLHRVEESFFLRKDEWYTRELSSPEYVEFMAR